MLLPPATWTLCCALTENSENDNTITTYIRTLYLLQLALCILCFFYMVSKIIYGCNLAKHEIA